MKVEYGRQLSDEEKSIIAEISARCGVSKDTARLLLYRNVDSLEKAERFLHPDKKGFYDPFLLSDMREAVGRINRAKVDKEKVLVFGDYDADGICAATILCRALSDYGIFVRAEVPEREDGYGLNTDTIFRLAKEEKIDLLITVDCGISDRDKIEIIKNSGIDVIVTDHHEPPELLPNCLKINPKISEQYPCKILCGAGVAYKLCRALIGEKADDYLDFAALATVADSMELVDENRCIVAEGLKLISGKNARAPFKYLVGDVARKINSQTLAFQIAPRINAGGRMGDAKASLKAFASNDENEIYDYCVKLNTYNISRQVECDTIYREAKEKIRASKSSSKSVITVADDKWKTGFIGIVAAKLVEDFSRPVIVFAKIEGGYKGSARSVDGVNIYEALLSVKELLITFGGHSQAAGVAVSEENYDKLTDALCEYVAKYRSSRTEKTVVAEWKTEGGINPVFAREIEKLEPFGVGNRRPLFCVETKKAIFAAQLKSGSPHYGFNTDCCEMLNFNGEKDVETLSLPIKKDILFETNVSMFNGRESIKGFVKHVVPEYGDFSGLSAQIARSELLRAKSLQKLTFQQIKKSDVKLTRGFGTAFCVSNAESLKYFDNTEKLEKYLFRADAAHGENCIIVSPTSACGYEKIVWLDYPLSGVKEADNYIFDAVDATSSATILSELSCDREIFTDIFNYLVTLSGKDFFDSATAYNKYAPNFTAEQFVFASEVFIELGIFTVSNGKLFYNRSVKSQLNNSNIFRAVQSGKNC